ncbi:TPA: hypothetical protein ACN359_004476 [Vibrio parahaemolyticus]|uniref:hypothetical protein n=1 Tax=Vibrio diabolicus TaxID=50719 RepID=UPI00186A25C1|nr:hypothetical protein [Vibrio diabolicus]EGU4190283.1 hypothetical protein [Vibrio parahaemolyticus]EHR5466297.1 hypothetical protein [Vibrio parahaemolyticus]EJG0909132.1 hypothetical protein [Vibrio parahaemolyticus]MBE4142936.1 hypothetical protein [Vibrio parahaemolyticus]MCS0378623.1 hypothetical protein [Vibrio diabolicus]
MIQSNINNQAPSINASAVVGKDQFDRALSFYEGIISSDVSDEVKMEAIKAHVSLSLKVKENELELVKNQNSYLLEMQKGANKYNLDWQVEANKYYMESRKEENSYSLKNSELINQNSQSKCTYV